MRTGYVEFTSRQAEFLAIGPNSTDEFRNYWREHALPFPGLPDPDHVVSKLYRQEINLFKLGRMPLNSVVDIEGRIRFVHFGSNMSDIPDNETFLNVIERLNESSK